MSKILIVEDETDLAQELELWFKREKYVVEVAHTGQDAIELLQVYKYDVVLLDWMLPVLDGPGVCTKFRASGGRTPIIFLTAKKATAETEYGLDCGADYYVKKPVSLRELSAVVRAAIRRSSKSPDKVSVNNGDIYLDLMVHTVTKAGRLVHLEPREFSLLEFLMRNPDQVFSPDSLIDRVWPSDSLVSPDSLRTYIKSLRRKLDTDSTRSIIKNVRGVGYKLESHD